MPDKIWNTASYTRLSRDDGDKAFIGALHGQLAESALHLVGVAVVQRRRWHAYPRALDVDGEILPGLPAPWRIGDQPGVEYGWFMADIHCSGPG